MKSFCGSCFSFACSRRKHFYFHLDIARRETNRSRMHYLNILFNHFQRFQFAGYIVGLAPRTGMVKMYRISWNLLLLEFVFLRSWKALHNLLVYIMRATAVMQNGNIIQIITVNFFWWYIDIWMRSSFLISDTLYYAAKYNSIAHSIKILFAVFFLNP